MDLISFSNKKWKLFVAGTAKSGKGLFLQKEHSILSSGVQQTANVMDGISSEGPSLLSRPELINTKELEIFSTK